MWSTTNFSYFSFASAADLPTPVKRGDGFAPFLWRATLGAYVGLDNIASDVWMSSAFSSPRHMLYNESPSGASKLSVESESFARLERLHRQAVYSPKEVTK
jgi:hypothetical protein